MDQAGRQLDAVPGFDPHCGFTRQAARLIVFRLDNKTALIAGGTRGVGLEIALTLARIGATLALNYAHDDAAAAQALSQLRQIAPKSLLLKADLEDEEQT